MSLQLSFNYSHFSFFGKDILKVQFSIFIVLINYDWEYLQWIIENAAQLMLLLIFSTFQVFTWWIISYAKEIIFNWGQRSHVHNYV